MPLEKRPTDTTKDIREKAVISLWLAGRVVRLWLGGQLSAQQAAAQLGLSNDGFADLLDCLGLTAWEFKDLSLAQHDVPSVALSAEELAAILSRAGSTPGAAS